MLNNFKIYYLSYLRQKKKSCILFLKNQRIQYFFRMLGYTDESEQLGGWNIDNHHLNINGKNLDLK